VLRRPGGRSPCLPAEGTSAAVTRAASAASTERRPNGRWPRARRTIGCQAGNDLVAEHERAAGRPSAATGGGNDGGIIKCGVSGGGVFNGGVSDGGVINGEIINGVVSKGEAINAVSATEGWQTVKLATLRLETLRPEMLAGATVGCPQ